MSRATEEDWRSWFGESGYVTRICTWACLDSTGTRRKPRPQMVV